MERKTGTDHVILHFVNYDKPLKNVRVTLNLDGVVKQIDGKRIQMFSPDAGAKQVSVSLCADTG